MYQPAITAIGTAKPQYSGSQQEITDFMADALQLRPAEKRRLISLYQATGIEFRHSVLADFKKPRGQFDFFPNEYGIEFPSTAKRMQAYQAHALPLALRAIKNCLDDIADFDKKNITHLITVSCTGMYAPGIDIEIIAALGLSTSLQRTSVNFMGCYGAFNGIKLAAAICQADVQANVLVVSVELCTLHFQKSKNPDQVVASAIFSDGAGAVLIQARPIQTKPIQTKSSTDKYFSLKHFYCDILPKSSKEMCWHIGDQGFDMILSSYVPQSIEQGIAVFLKKLLTHSNLIFTNIDIFAIHPGGLKILQACESALNITPIDNRYSYQVLRENGNMSSATILFVLEKIWQDIKVSQTKQRIFSCAFGPGLTLESMILEI